MRKRVHRTELPDAPRVWQDLINHAHADGFRCAAKKELDELNRRNTWKIIDRWSIDRTIKPLPLKWVFTYKFDKDGYLDRYKARICVRGDLQPPTEKDKYAATLAARIFRALIAIMARFGLKAVQLDAVNAFINARLTRLSTVIRQMDLKCQESSIGYYWHCTDCHVHHLCGSMNSEEHSLN
jgi:hypothetical protein